MTYAVIMAGGFGTRFWPVSRATTPKQLVNILGATTMIQATVARVQPLIPPERVLIITTAALAEETRRQLPMLKPEQIIAEPVGRDTAAAVALAAVIVQRLDPTAAMVLLPADQVITPADRFQRCLRAGLALAARGQLVTFGIPPRFPATGYGYIKLAQRLSDEDGYACNKVLRFVEKPDAETAKSYLAEGGYRWNAGIFAWRASTVLDQLDLHCPWLTAALRPLGAAYGTPGFAAALAAVYGPLKRISIDYALMEKASEIAVVTVDFAWDDLGSWDALYDHLPVGAAGTISQGAVLAQDCRDCLLVAAEGAPLIAGVGLDKLTVVATRDAVLVIPRGRSQQVKQIVDALKAQGRSELL